MNNYLLKPAHRIPTPYQFLDTAILVGTMLQTPFTVEMAEPEMIVCYWQPGMDGVAYNRPYVEYMENCQRELVRVMG